MATITVRALDPDTWEPLAGNGQDSFISDLQAVTQIIATRLKLFQGEWFLDLLDGLPLFQNILGSSGSVTNLKVVVNLISQRIKLSPYVTLVTNVKASYQNRQFKFSATAETSFGNVFIVSSPGSSASLTVSN